MGKIRILPDEVASQVAAGEVVERPASIVKELAENSLDAGATRIQIDFARGGSKLVCVQDDGSGMDREDALLALERHATSKIRTGEDLSTVRTMGFRGEAVPSIASVSRFRLVTRPPEQEAGTEILVAGGKIEQVRETGAPPGTLVEVKDLFYNLPARRKFLRGEETEASHITHILQGMALAHPDVAFECRRDGRPVLMLPRAASLAVRISDLFGADHLGRLVEMEEFVGDTFSLRGFLARPGQGRRDRLQQFVILNGRPVHCPALQQPLREAYAQVLAPGEHPICVLLVEMDPEWVDCNVHPAKREVRLRQPEPLRRAVYEAARKALDASRAAWSQPFRAPEPPPEIKPFLPPAPQPEIPFQAPPAPTRQVPPLIPVEREDKPEPPEPEIPFRVLGEIGTGYLILEGNEGLVLLDIRSASERIFYETLRRQMDTGTVPIQRLLLPAVIKLPAREHAWITEHAEDLQSAGFLVEPFGGDTLKIEGLPAFAGQHDPRKLLHDTASALRATGKLPTGAGLRDSLARSVCHFAAEENLGGDLVRASKLVRELLLCELPYANPLGRPTMIQFSFAELERKFGRA